MAINQAGLFGMLIPVDIKFALQLSHQVEFWSSKFLWKCCFSRYDHDQVSPQDKTSHYLIV